MCLDSQVDAAWIAAVAAIIVMAVTAILNVVLYYKGNKAARESERRRSREEALFLALEVIDHVFANSRFNGRPKSNPHSWDISMARAAMNKMTVYCKDPQRAVSAFLEAVGTSNPEVQTEPSRYGPRELARFREIVREELELQGHPFSDPNLTWLRSLPGTDTQ
jgi:hypothetical protein